MNPAYIGRGTLQVVVTVGDDPSPIQGARVRVTDPADGAVQLIAEDGATV